jgi:hypothetical protein
VEYHGLSDADVAERIGPLGVLHSEMSEFARSARVFSGDSPRLIEDYPEQWVAVIDGDVAAHAPTFDAVMDQLDADGKPRTRAMVRYVSEQDQTMIL